jgi:hypothetical protein
VIFFLLTAITGNDIWISNVSVPVIGRITISQFIVTILLVSQFIAWIIFILYKIVRNSKKNDASDEKNFDGRKLEYWPLINQIFGFFLIFAIIFFAATLCNQDILLKMPILAALLFSFLFTHSIISMQVSHVSKQKYSPWTKLWIVSITFIIGYIIYQLIHC